MFEYFERFLIKIFELFISSWSGWWNGVVGSSLVSAEISWGGIKCWQAWVW